ncbi:RICIN domain-containing protein [Nucisporomicrobium flavum]|uniref:RICIN domain-containing protein n=1 Tax=Nucisporomicrobium flavum TaxID=2785915 RepID=UPI0018F49116|nr:RICIN domain-containing protein [Nucisporomicrobium flavum]
MGRIIRTILGAAAAAMLMAGLSVGAGASPASAGTVSPKIGGSFTFIRNVGNNLCLEPAGLSTAEFAAIVQNPCVTTGLESIAQGWESEKVGTNHYKFRNQLSGFCFDAFDGAFNGARLLQGTCVPISNEEYNTGASLPNVVKIESRVHFTDTGFCVDVPGATTQPNTAMQIFRCNGTLAQRWVVGF